MTVAATGKRNSSATLGSVVWILASATYSNVLRLGSNLLLTRWLAPEMFGLMAIATTVGIMSAMLSDIGLRQNIIRSDKGDDPVFLNTAWTVQVIRGVALWTVACLLSLGLALLQTSQQVFGDSAYGHPLLPWIVATGTINLAITAFQSTKVPVSIRSMQYDLSSRLICCRLWSEQGPC